jgi:tetratricopeptide (TPR) repeat protein
MRRLLIAVMAVFVLLGMVGQGTTVSDLVAKADELRDQGSNCNNSCVPGALNESIEMYKKAIGQDRLDADAWYGLALAKHMKPTYNSDGEHLVEQQEAIGCMERAIEIDSANPKYWEGLGIVTSLVDFTTPQTYDADYNKSLNAFDRASELWTNNSDKAHSLTGKAFMLIQIGTRENQPYRFKEAIQACNEALKLDANDPDAAMFKEEAIKRLGAS